METSKYGMSDINHVLNLDKKLSNRSLTIYHLILDNVKFCFTPITSVNRDAIDYFLSHQDLISILKQHINDISKYL